MKRIKGFVKGNIKLFIAFVVGAVLFGGGVYAATVAANTVSYSNASSGLAATNVQGAIDELYEKANSNFVSAVTYNESSCVTGEESTCVKSTCYRTKTSGSCPTGTIINYKVNEHTVVRFHVMKDNGTTMTMQSQRNTVYSTAWNSDGGTGPTTILTALERATTGWSNVIQQTYTPTNSSSRTARARMMTLSEAQSYGGCSTSMGSNSCGTWILNYLSKSSTSGKWGYVDENADTWYWIDGTCSSGFCIVNGYGFVSNNPSTSESGARAVVNVSK